MSGKVILVLLAFIVWSVVSWRWYTCRIKGFCNGDVVAASIDTGEARNQSPLTFSWSSSSPITSSQFGALRDSLSGLVGPNEALTITGHYTEEEENTTEFANLGLARAQQVKQLLANQMDTSQVGTAAELIASTEAMQTTPFEGAEFAVVPVIPDDAEVVELNDRTIIYFPFGSSNPELSTAINQYLTGLAERLQDSDQTVIITGHTDNVGDEKPNYELGLKRANIVKDILAERGISADRIEADSEGEAQPLATNDTEIGRKKNRRIELRVESN
ncbi:MAG: OmpA family protein [Bacteroidota bacterium]